MLFKIYFFELWNDIFFLNHNSKSIYCLEYIPKNADRKKTGIIVCPSIWGERIRTHRILTNLARELQKFNYYVFTCNYFGDGNSGGESFELTFESMCDDIKSLYKYLIDKFEIEELILIGFRLGANAIIPSLDKITVSKALLIDPILNPLNYFKDALRANLTSQLTRYKKVVKNRDELIREIRENKFVNVDGFLIGKKLWESFEKNSPLSGNYNFNGYVIIISSEHQKKYMEKISDFSKEFSNVFVYFVEKELVLTSWKKYLQRPPILFSKIIKEITLNPPIS